MLVLARRSYRKIKSNQSMQKHTSTKIQQAAKQIQDATALLITTGAGMGVDSG